MDPAFLTSDGFWSDPAPFAAVAPGVAAPVFPETPELLGQVLFQTSGSSGAPRWIALSKDALHVSAQAVNRHLGVETASRWGLALPVHHVGGFGVIARARAAGCGLHGYGQKWNPQTFAAWLSDHRITHTSLVPTQVHDLVTAGLRVPDGLLAIVVGGGRLDETAGRAARALGWPVLASYGMTEAGSQIATQPPACLRDDYHSAPIPLLDIWDADVDADGRLRISGPAMFSGTLLPKDGGWSYVKRESPWHLTQDRVSLDGRWLTPLGRADTLVKVLGELVDPEHIERELLEISGGALHPGIFAVVALPDARTEHALFPVFEGVATPEQDTWVRAYNESAAGFRRLRDCVRIPVMPRSDLGKIRRAALAEMVAALRERSSS
jgi:O-succinylbenzoic acid--CoA ligase